MRIPEDRGGTSGDLISDAQLRAILGALPPDPVPHRLVKLAQRLAQEIERRRQPKDMPAGRLLMR